MALWFSLGAFHVESSLALCSRVVVFFFSVLFYSTVIISLGDERAGLCASRITVCLFCTCLIFSFFSSA